MLLLAMLVILDGCETGQEAVSPQEGSSKKLWMKIPSRISSRTTQQVSRTFVHIRSRNPKDVEEAEFVSHIDGDTAKLWINGKVETVQFLLVDTPETQHPEWSAQPLGEEASEYTKKMLSEADRITLEYGREKG